MDLTHSHAVIATSVLLEALNLNERGAQARLARMLDVTPQTVSKWINGTLPINPQWYRRIEDALDLPPFTIARRTGEFDEYGLSGRDLERAEVLWAKMHGDPSERRRGGSEPGRASTTLADRVAALERRVATLEGATSVPGAIEAAPELSDAAKKRLRLAYDALVDG